MEFFSDPEIIKLSALGCAFVIGVLVCFYVAVRETAELKQRRRAKQLMYEDEVNRELNRKKRIMQKIQEQDSAADTPTQIDGQQPLQRASNQSFA